MPVTDGDECGSVRPVDTAIGSDRPVVVAARLVLLGSIAAVVMVGLYAAMVRTSTGQRLDDVVFEGRKATFLGARRAVALVLTATVPAVLVGWMTIVVAAVRRRRTVDGLITLAGVVATVVVARALKAELPRPGLFVPAFAGDANSFPSGHTAAVTATLLGGLAVCRPDVRGTAAVAAAAVVAAYSVAMLYSGWHRPADIAAGVVLATAVMAPTIAARVLFAPDPLIEEAAGPRPAVLLGSTIALDGWSRFWVVVALAVGSAASTLALRRPVSDLTQSLVAHLVAASLSAAGAGALVFVFAAALGPRRPTGLKGSETGTR